MSPVKLIFFQTVCGAHSRNSALKRLPLTIARIPLQIATRSARRGDPGSRQASLEPRHPSRRTIRLAWQKHESGRHSTLFERSRVERSPVSPLRSQDIILRSRRASQTYAPFSVGWHAITDYSRLDIPYHPPSESAHRSCSNAPRPVSISLRP